MTEEYLSVDDVAEEIGVAKVTVWRWIKRDAIETFRVPGDRRTRIRRRDADALKQPISRKQPANDNRDTE